MSYSDEERVDVVAGALEMKMQPMMEKIAENSSKAIVELK